MHVVRVRVYNFELLVTVILLHGSTYMHYCVLSICLQLIQASSPDERGNWQMAFVLITNQTVYLLRKGIVNSWQNKSCFFCTFCCFEFILCVSLCSRWCRSRWSGLLKRACNSSTETVLSNGKLFFAILHNALT